MVSNRLDQFRLGHFTLPAARVTECQINLSAGAVPSAAISSASFPSILCLIYSLAVFGDSSSVCSFDTCLTSGVLSHLLGITPENWIDMQLFVAFAQKQNFGAGRDVVPANRFRVVWDVAIGFIDKTGKIIFTGH